MHERGIMTLIELQGVLGDRVSATLREDYTPEERQIEGVVLWQQVLLPHLHGTDVKGLMKGDMTMQEKIFNAKPLRLSMKHSGVSRSMFNA